MKLVRFATSAVALTLLAGIPGLAFAQAAPASRVAVTNASVPEHHMPHPVKVSTCNPQRNVYMSGGFAPGYWPGGPYWGWPSVYGYNYYSYPVQGNPTLSINYMNATDIVMKDIEFGLIVHGNLVAEVRDVGTFSPNAEIKHEFGLNPNVFPIQTSFAQCVPLKITFVDGSKWKNPHLPALRQSIYGHP
jgi:hypothetical protein